MDSPIDLVTYMEWEYRIKDQQIEVHVCPFCHADDWNFRINMNNGMWDCKHLNRHGNKNTSGNLYRLKKALGLTLDVQGQQQKVYPLDYDRCREIEKAHETLMSSPMLLATLCDEWGVSEQRVRDKRLGYKVDTRTGVPFILIPHMVGGEACNIKYRSWFGHPKAFYRVSGASSVLYNEDYLNTRPKKVMLCEGEKDQLLAEEAGIDYAVGMTGGAGTLLERWFALLEPVEEILIAYDGDVAGQEGVQKLIKRLGQHRVKVVPLPNGKDIADIVKDQGAAALHALIAKANEPAQNAVSKPTDIALQIITQPEIEALPTPWDNVNAVLNGGTYPSQLITVASPPKIGKTTLTYSWSHWTAAVQGVPSLYWCVEMPKDQLTLYACGMQLGVGRKPSKADLLIYANRDRDIPFYLGYDKSTEVDLIIQTFRDAHARFGIEFFVFDNLHFAVRDTNDKVQAMENAVKAFKSLAMELNVRVVVIAHPKKLDPRKGADMNYYDIGWSGSFASDSDTIIILHRDRVVNTENSFKPEMMFKVDAGRYTQGGTTYLHFRDKAMRFRPMSKREVKALLANR